MIGNVAQNSVKRLLAQCADFDEGKTGVISGLTDRYVLDPKATTSAGNAIQHFRQYQAVDDVPADFYVLRNCHGLKRFWFVAHISTPIQDGYPRGASGAVYATW